MTDDGFTEISVGRRRKSNRGTAQEGGSHGNSSNSRI